MYKLQNMSEIKIGMPENTDKILDFLNRASAEIGESPIVTNFLAEEFGGTDQGRHFIYKIKVPLGFFGRLRRLKGYDMEPVIASVWPHHSMDLVASKRGTDHILRNVKLTPYDQDPFSDPYS